MQLQKTAENRGRTAAFHNLGCKVNAYETEAMQQQLMSVGYTLVPFEEKADIYIINTCSVTNIADRKSRQMLHRARKMNPDAVVVAVGCYVQTAKEETGLAVDADILIGNNRKKELPLILDEYFRTHSSEERVCHDQTAVSVSDPQRCEDVLEKITDINHSREYENLSITDTFEHTRAFIKVQDGCNQFCSYCIIPYARGRVRSRAREDVLREVSALVQNGISEFVLTGIHLSSYGQDCGSDLLSLIRSTASVEGVQRIRLGSLEPRIITEEFAEGIRELPQMCPHFHLSLQSGCDSVLKRMNRKYTTQEYAQKCGILRSYFQDPALTTDVIVGFPGESEEEFARTKEFLTRISFYETHIFKYSRREGTVAARMPDQIQESVKAERSDVLLALNREKMAFYESKWEGRKGEVLFEEKIRLNNREYYRGHSKEYIQVLLDAGKFPQDTDIAGRILCGTLTGDQAPDGYMLIQNANL